MGKGKERLLDERELGEIWRSIEKAHGRRLTSQSAALDLAGHALREEGRRGTFLEEVVGANDVGRMEGQDCERLKGGEGELITVDQFIHESKFHPSPLLTCEGYMLTLTYPPPPPSSLYRRTCVSLLKDGHLPAGNDLPHSRSLDADDQASVGLGPHGTKREYQGEFCEVAVWLWLWCWVWVWVGGS